MKSIVFKFSVLGIGLVFFLSCGTIKEKGSKYFGYELVWNDEFSANGIPDKRKWNYEIGFVRNLENQWYQKENAYCKDGFLIIEAKKELKVNPNFISREHHDWTKNRDSIKITSSCLTTQGKHSWKHGRFEMRAKIPVAKGMWPAFWTLGVNGNWPENGEIDIMEYYMGKILANVAWKSSKPDTEWDSETILLTDFKKNWADEFHIWRMDWDVYSVKLYLDDKLINETNIKETIQSNNQKIMPFQQPHYLLLNLAVGGINGGDFTNGSFPSKYIIDYVRVYQQTLQLN